MKNQDMYEQFVESLAFDKHNLDAAILHHSELYFAVSEAYAQAASLRDEAKKLMEESYARNSLRIREQASEEGKKLTEDLVKQLTLLDDDYKEDTTKYLKAKLDADLWGALKESYSSRGYMIKEIAELWKASYFATEAVKGPAVEELEYEANRATAAKKRREFKLR